MDMQTSPLALLKDPSLLKTDALINGEWVKGSQRFDVLDPSNGRKLADVANLGADDAARAIAAADAAWPASSPLNKASPMQKPKAKWPMAPVLSSGTPKKPSG